MRTWNLPVVSRMLYPLSYPPNAQYPRPMHTLAVCTCAPDLRQVSSAQSSLTVHSWLLAHAPTPTHTRHTFHFPKLVHTPAKYTPVPAMNPPVPAMNDLIDVRRVSCAEPSLTVPSCAVLRHAPTPTHMPHTSHFSVPTTTPAPAVRRVSSEEPSLTVPSWLRSVASRSSSTLPTGPNQNLSRNTISSSSSPATAGGRHWQQSTVAGVSEARQVARERESVQGLKAC